jgi:endonuclease-3
MDTKKIRELFARLKKANPQPTTELIYHNAFELLVAVILSAQATDKSVNKATEKLFKVAPSPEKILKLGEEKLRTYVKTIGLYKNKAKNIMLTCRLLVDQFHSQVPSTREALESLPGVGRKTANVILNTCFKQPVIAVDTHIFRVAQRIGLAKGRTPLAIEEQLMKVIPLEYLHDAHHWLILHGRYICTARKPKCPDCVINKWCEFPDKTRALPLKAKKKP